MFNAKKIARRGLRKKSAGRHLSLCFLQEATSCSIGAGCGKAKVLPDGASLLPGMELPVKKGHPHKIISGEGLAERCIRTAAGVHDAFTELS
jgi:hypothetical protein